MPCHQAHSCCVFLARLFLCNLVIVCKSRCCYCCSDSKSCRTLQPCGAACQASLSFTMSQSLLKLMSIESMMPSNHLIFYLPLLLLPSIFFSIRVFSNDVCLELL